MKSQQLVQMAARSTVQVHLPVFEGPFDLLIYLVERDKLDIYDIAIADITRNYLDSLQVIEFDPELASDFIYMAAYLLELKSRSLLPRVERAELAQESDPREELILRLVEYKRFKELAVQLDALASGTNHLYVRRPSIPTDVQEVRPLLPMSLDNLFSAFIRAVAKIEVEVREMSGRGMLVGEKMGELKSILRRGSASFAQLTTEMGLAGIVVVFLAVLELVRLGEVEVFQESVFASIKIKAVEEDVVDD